MAVSKFTSAIGGNDFNINVGSTYSVTDFTQEYAAGSYSFTSAQLDTTMDVYAYNSLGTLVGYTNGKGLTVSAGFNKLVILGGTVGDVLSFSYKTTYYAVAETNEVTAGPVILSTSPTFLPNVNSSTTVTGLNFATNIAATFTGTDNLPRAAKSVVRGSVTSLVVTRPDVLPVAYSPYSLTVTNPSVAYQPTGSNTNILTGLTVGAAPIWVTAAGGLTNGFGGQAYSYQLSATDLTDAGSSISYSLTSGSLPSGVSLSSSGLISGLPGQTSAIYSFTVRATDSGGNSLDRAFSIEIVALYTPTTAAAANLTSGTYQFYAAGMAAPVSAFYQPASGLSGSDGSGWIRTFLAPAPGGTPTVNLLDLNIPFTKLLVFANNQAQWGRANFSANKLYNTAGNGSNYDATSAANNFGGSGSGTRVYLGYAGGHGIYNPSQSTCSWSTNIAGAIGAGYDGTCGTFPNGLRWGYQGSNAGPNYTIASGNAEHWITW
jgi:hypothetical protein